MRVSSPPPYPFEVTIVRKLESLSSSRLKTFLRLDLDRDGRLGRDDLRTFSHNVLGIDLTVEQMDAIFLRFSYFKDEATEASIVKESSDDKTLEMKTYGEKENENATPSKNNDGLRYPEFVNYLDSTIGAMVTRASAANGFSRLDLPSVGPSAGSLPVSSSHESITSNLRHQLRNLIQAHSKSSGTRGLFLEIDTDRTGLVKRKEFVAWVENMGWKLNDLEVRVLLGERAEDDGISYRDFAAFVDSLGLENRQLSFTGSQDLVDDKIYPKAFEIQVARKLKSLSNSLMQTFLCLDADRDGYISRVDLKTSFYNVLGIDLSREQMDAIFLRFAHFEDDHRDLLEKEVENEEIKRSNATSERKVAASRHGIRYHEFVKYLDATAGAIVTGSSAVNGFSRLDLARVGPSTNSQPVSLSHESIALNLRRQLRSLIRAHSKSAAIGDLFLEMDTHRSGRVTKEEFIDWVANMGWKLTESELETIFYSSCCLGEDDGILYKDFVDVVQGLDDEFKASEAANHDLAEKENIHLSTVASGDNVDSKALELLEKVVVKFADDSKTDCFIAKTISKQLHKKNRYLLDIFKEIDLDGTGHINREEFSKALLKSGLDVSPERAESLFQKFDLNGDGVLSKGEFIRFVQCSNDGNYESIITCQTAGVEEKRLSLISSVAGHEDAGRCEEIANQLDEEDIAVIMTFRTILNEGNIKMRKIFEELDKDGSKSLSSHELKLGLEQMGIDIKDHHVEHIMRRFDKENTGRIKYHEFVKLVSADLSSY